MNIKLFTLLLLFCYSQMGLAQQECAPKSYIELVKCAESTALDIKLSEQQLKSAIQIENSAKQWLNPELEVERFSKGSEFSETTATLLFNLTMGRRGADIKVAEAERKKETVNSEVNISQSRLNLMLGFYKLSQLKREIAIEDETGGTFNKIIKQFERRPALSPEQKVSLAVFKMALADHQLSLTKLKNEELEISLKLSALTGLNLKEIEKNLPARKNDWMKLSSAEKNTSPQEKVAMAELEIAQGRKARANSESWPDLKIGPSFKETKANDSRETIAGVSLSMPLPVFSWNLSGRSLAAEKLTEAKLNLDVAKANSQSGRLVLEQRYKTHVANLESILNSKAVSDKHKEIESLFFKGVISGAIVIEAHRQLFDLEQKRNELEFGAIDALGQILILDSKFNGVIL